MDKCLPSDKFCFFAEPDRYGRFGHQSFSLLSAWAFAHRLNGWFLPNQYSYFAHKYNMYVDYGASAKALHEGGLMLSQYVRIAGTTADQHGNTKYMLDQQGGIEGFIDELKVLARKKADRILIQLPFDQTAGIFMNTLSSSMKQDLRRIFGKLISQEAPSACLHIAVHIRRGDVNQRNHPDWYIPDKYFENLVIALFHYYNDRVLITLLVQGRFNIGEEDILREHVAAGRLRISSTSQPWTNDREIHDFSLMLGADLIIAGQSSFSQLASLVKDGHVEVCLVKNANSRLPHSLDIRSLVAAENELATIEQAKVLIGTKLANTINEILRKK